MSKKIVGDDGKTYVQKKPFYKRVWFWLLVIIVVIVLGGGLGGGSDKKDTNGGYSNASSKKDSSSKEVNKETISLEQFDKLQVGDLSNNGNGGTSYKDVVSAFGNPSSTTSSTVQGQTVEMDTWANLGGDYQSMELSFGGDGDDRALSSKSITSAKSILSGTKISQSEYDAITTDGSMKLSDLVNKFGQPSIMSVYSIMNTETKTIVWSNVNSDLGTGISLTVSGDNTVIGKVKASN